MGREIGFPLRLISLPLLGELLSRPSLHGSRSFAEDLVFDKSLIIDEDVQFDYEISCLPGSQQAFLKTLRSLGSFGGQKRSFYGPILEKLSTIAQPTLVLWGREDTIVPVQHSEAARKIPNARIHIFEHCRHMPQFEHIVEFDQALQAFLRD